MLLQQELQQDEELQPEEKQEQQEQQDENLKISEPHVLSPQSRRVSFCFRLEAL